MSIRVRQDRLEYESTLVSINTSLARFREGGAAMLKAEKINQKVVSVGKKFMMPFVRGILRVWVVV